MCIIYLSSSYVLVLLSVELNVLAVSVLWPLYEFSLNIWQRNSLMLMTFNLTKEFG
jgi:hypothetical protein